MSIQLPLELGHRPAQGREDFLVAPCNEMAVAWVDRWPDWSGGILALVGPPACGKSHLVEVWRRRSGAARLEPRALDGLNPLQVLAGNPFMVIEDVTKAALAAPARQEGFFHLINALRAQGGGLLVTAEMLPANWSIALEDLASRLRSLPQAVMSGPDDGLLEALLVKQFHDRQLRLAPEVLHFLLPRMERSFAGLRRLVARLDRLSLAQRREITVPLAREAIAELEEEAKTSKHEGG